MVDSFPLCKEVVAYRPLSNSETCFDSFWSWKWTKRLRRWLLRGQSCRRTVLKWEAKRVCVCVCVCVWVQSVFPASPPGHCSNCQKVEPLIHISPPTPFLYLCAFAHPSSLCLWACLGVVIYQAQFWQTVGWALQDVGSVEESADGLRARAAQCIEQRSFKELRWAR